MRNKLEKFEKKHTKMLLYGFKHNLIFPYPDSLFDALRPYSIGGFPASIALFVNELCNGHCYDKARTISLAVPDAKVIHADINSLRVLDDGKNAEHAIVETNMFGGGKTWIIDTSIGLIFDKKYYYEFEQPTINHVFEKDFLMQDPMLHEIIAGNFENDKYILPLVVPMIEAAIKNSNHLHTVIYREKILSELELFKKAVGYDAIQAEIDNDVKLMYTNSKALDEKFGIVRDEYGMEISRNGVPNPYYYTREEMEASNAYYESIKNDPEKMKEYLTQIALKAYEETEKEMLETQKVAQERLEIILQNPTANFYELFYDTNSKGLNPNGDSTENGI